MIEDGRDAGGGNERGWANGKAGLPYCAFSVKDVRRGDGARVLDYIASVTGTMLEDASGRRHFPRAPVAAHHVEQLAPSYAAQRYQTPLELWTALEAAETNPRWSVALDIFARGFGAIDPDELTALADDFARRVWVRDGAGVLLLAYAKDAAKPHLPSSARFVVSMRRLGDPQLGRPFRNYRDEKTQRLWRLQWLESWRQYAQSRLRGSELDAAQADNLRQHVLRIEAETARLMGEGGLCAA